MAEKPILPKFRAWDKIHEEMKEVAAINFVEKAVVLWTTGKHARATIFRDFENVILMQGSGLEDKNKKEIFDGDIIRYSPDANMGEGPVYIESGCFRVEGDFDALLYHFSLKSLEVIGNVYDNPELLEV